jgi:hypothetical protein
MHLPGVTAWLPKIPSRSPCEAVLGTSMQPVYGAARGPRPALARWRRGKASQGAGTGWKRRTASPIMRP